MFGKKKVVYILGAGAAYGFAHVGVLQYCEEHNLYPAAIGGTSIGALMGALYASGISSRELLEITEELNLMRYLRIFAPGMHTGGFVKQGGVRQLLEPYLSDLNIEDLPIPFFCCATDILTGEEIVFTKGSVIEAVLASISIPILFVPYQYQDRYLVDGALVNPVPWNHAYSYGDFALSVSFRANIDKNKKPKKNKNKQIQQFPLLEQNNVIKKALENTEEDGPGMGDTLSNTLMIYQQALLKDLKPVPFKHSIIDLDLSLYNMFEFLKAKEIYQSGYRQAAKYSNLIRRLGKNSKKPKIYR